MCTTTHSHGILPGGCYPWPPYPWPNPGRYHQTLPDSTVGWEHRPWPFGCFPWADPVKGYGLDLDGDGRYTRGRDGVLAFDYNGDGQLSQAEIERSNAALKAFGGNFDLNGDGQVGWFERLRGRALQREMRQRDLDGDGTLSSWELAAAGGRVWVDRDRDGRADGGEVHSVYNFPGPWGESRHLDYVNPRWGTAHSTPNWWWDGWGWDWDHHHHHHHHHHDYYHIYGG